MLDGRFNYFCDLTCRGRLVRGDAVPRRARSTSSRPPRAAELTPLPVLEPAVTQEMLPAFLDAAHQPYEETPPSEAAALELSPIAGLRRARRITDGALEPAQTEPSALREDDEPPPSSRPADEAPREDEDDEPGDADTLLLFTAVAAGALSFALMLIGDSPSVTTARAAVAAVGAMALVGRAATVPRDPSDAHPAVLLAAPVFSAGAALSLRAAQDPLAAKATSIAGVIVASAALLLALRKRARADAEAERRWIASALSLPGRRVGRSDAVIVAAHELRAGEQIEVQAGELTPVDLTIMRGQATVLPWLGATAQIEKREGEALVAGSRVLEGSVQGLASCAGDDRAWARLLLDPTRRVDTSTTLSRIGRLVASQGAIGAAALASLAVYANNGRLADVMLAGIAAYASLATTMVASIAGLHSLRGALAAARRGIVYRSPDTWDAASRVSAAVFLARGTLLLGEPDVVEIEPTGRADAAQVLAWVAGAEGNQTHPIALAVQRAARQRSIQPDAVRSPHVLPGLGVKAITSTGEALLVGSRALMLEERVSIAMLEGRVGELEGLGRMVLLVAISGKLAGIVALQDGLRPGARASVQHLLDVDVEPVLLSGDSRETCETLARALDIDHVRPEVLPAERPGEIRRLVEAGARVAAVGRPQSDAAVLDAADVSVALGAAGASPNEWSVSLAGDDVRDAALALALAHRTRAEARMALVLASSPGVIGALAVAFGLLPPIFAPLAGLIGGLVAVLHARATATLRREPAATPWDLVIPSPPRERHE